MKAMVVRTQQKPFDISQEVNSCTEGLGEVGGVATFTGLVRGSSGSRQVIGLEVEAHQKITIQRMQQLRVDVMEKFELLNLTIVHRVGKLMVGEVIVCIVAAGKHRKEALDGCQFAIDELKKVVPLWKKEVFTDGDGWV